MSAILDDQVDENEHAHNHSHNNKYSILEFIDLTCSHFCHFFAPRINSPIIMMNKLASVE